MIKPRNHERKAFKEGKLDGLSAEVIEILKAQIKPAIKESKPEVKKKEEIDIFKDAD
jgi:hypothetical protein